MFPSAEYQIPPFSVAIRGCLVVPAHQVCYVCSRPYTDCGQLIKEASHLPYSPCVSITAGVSPTSPSHIFPSLFPDLFSYLPFIIRPSNLPFSCFKAVSLHIFPVIFLFLFPEVYCFGLGLCITFPQGALCHVWLYCSRASSSHEMD